MPKKKKAKRRVKKPGKPKLKKAFVEMATVDMDRNLEYTGYVRPRFRRKIRQLLRNGIFFRDSLTSWRGKRGRSYSRMATGLKEFEYTYPLDRVSQIYVYPKEVRKMPAMEGLPPTSAKIELNRNIELLKAGIRVPKPLGLLREQDLTRRKVRKFYLSRGIANSTNIKRFIYPIEEFDHSRTNRLFKIKMDRLYKEASRLFKEGKETEADAVGEEIKRVRKKRNQALEAHEQASQKKVPGNLRVILPKLLAELNKANNLGFYFGDLATRNLLVKNVFGKPVVYFIDFGEVERQRQALGRRKRRKQVIELKKELIDRYGEWMPKAQILALFEKAGY